MRQDMDHSLAMLRAAAESTRLRILALVRWRDLSVGELVQILDQSQPRLSHHLKILTQAGLVERLPEGAWVFYRAVSSGPAAQYLTAVFDLVDEKSQQFTDDRLKLAAITEQRATFAEAYFEEIADDWDTIRDLHSPNIAIEKAIRNLVGLGPFEKVIDFGTGTGRMLTLLADRAISAEGIDLSHQMLTVARANLAKAELSNCRVRKGDVLNTPFEDRSADLVIVHQVLHYLDDPSPVISEAARVLKPGGQLIVVDFAPHQLEFLREAHGHCRLGVRHDRLNDWTKHTGLDLAEPVAIEPPTSLEQGLTVHVWQAVKQSSLSKEIAA